MNGKVITSYSHVKHCYTPLLITTMLSLGKEPLLKSLQFIAEIISWNIWQMDGLKGVIPNSCIKLPKLKNDAPSSLFSSEDLGVPEDPILFDCPGCKNKDIHSHTGKYAKIKRLERGQKF